MSKSVKKSKVVSDKEGAPICNLTSSAASASSAATPSQQYDKDKAGFLNFVSKFQPPPQEWMTKFATLKTNKERFEMTYEYHKDCDLFQIFINDQKTNLLSDVMLNNGNKIFAEGDYSRALQFYTKALAYAETDNRVALAYGNRTTCHMKLQLYEECSLDCTRAIEIGYPEKLRKKIERRRARANELMAQRGPRQPYFQPIPIVPNHEKNPLVDSASCLIELRTNKEFGRHYVATYDLNVGDILMVEKAYISALDDDVRFHCHHCLELCYCLIPCDVCPNVMFCSNECKNEAYSNYHQYECIILRTLDCLNLPGNGSIPLKMIFQRKAEQKRKRATKGKTNDKKYRSDRFKEIIELKDDVGKLESNSGNMFYQCASASILYHLIKNYTSFFDSKEEEEFFKANIITLMSITRMNGCPISEMAKEPLDTYNPIFIGTAIFPATALFNHSCCPNVHRFFHGNTTIVRAMKSIKKGEQCFVTYGSPYYSQDKDSRQSMIGSRYHFVCKCRACEENWGLMPDLSTHGPKLKEFHGELAEEFSYNPSVEKAREVLPLLEIQAIKNGKFEPCRGYTTLIKLVKQCYEIFGNFRKY